nr:unnamed protein product [Callosobruchus chinensis]
MQSRKQLFD